MPIFETACPETSCSKYAVPVEHYYAHSTDVDAPCEQCGGPTRRLVSGFNSPLMGVISASKYADRTIPGPEAFQDGHIAWRRKTLSGKPEPVYIDTFEKQREFCKSEGLRNPSECPRAMSPDEGGKGVVNTQGMPGCWT